MSELRTAVRLAILDAVPFDRYPRLDDIDRATDGVLALIEERTPPAPADAEAAGHVAVLAGGAWQLEHPAGCPGDCAVLDLLDAIPAPAYGAGRWAATVTDGALTLFAPAPQGAPT